MMTTTTTAWTAAMIPQVTLWLLLSSSLRTAAQAPLMMSNIPISLTNDRRYVVKVKMSTNAPQEFSFALSTSTGANTVMGTSCSSCSGSPSYNQSLSTSAQSLQIAPVPLSILGQTVPGNAIKEDCSLIKQDGTAWAYPNQTIIVANQSSPLFSPGVSGVLGLGTNSKRGNFSDSIFGGWLSRNPTQSSFSYGMSLNPPFAESSDGGVLNWVVPDKTVVQSKISTKDRVKTSTSVNADWAVTVDKFSFITGTGPTISESNVIAIIDPFFTGIFLPQSLARPMYAGISNATSQPSATADTNVYSLPCDTKMYLTVTIGEVTVTLTENALIRPNGTSCISAFEEWADASNTEYLFGASFISALYLIFTVNGADTGSIGFGLRTRPSDKLSSGAIAGIVVGSVATLAISALVIVLLMRMFRKRPEVVNKEPTVQPFVAQPSDEHRGLLVPNTPTSPDPQFPTFVTVSSSPPTSYSQPISPQPSMSTLHTSTATQFSSANSRYTLGALPEVAITQPTPIEQAPPPYSGEDLTPQAEPSQRPMSASTRPGSASTQQSSSAAGYGFSTLGPYGTNEKQRV